MKNVNVIRRAALYIPLRFVKVESTLADHMRYMTITEFAELVKLSRQAVYNRIHAGKLHTISSENGKVFILVEDTEYEKIKGKRVDVS